MLSKIRIFGFLALLIMPSSLMALGFGSIPPDRVGVDQFKKEIKISDYKGQVVVLAFWASWCPHCMKELPILESISQVTNGKAKVIAVNHKEKRKQFRRIVRKAKHYTLSFVHDKQGRLGKEYGVGPIPHLVLIDKAGVISHVHTGYSDDLIPELEKQLTKLIGQ